MLESNVEWLYEQYIKEEYNFNHIMIIGKVLFISALISVIGYLPLTLAVAGIAYVFLAKREMTEAIRNKKMHEYLMDSVIECKDDIKSLKRISSG